MNVNQMRGFLKSKYPHSPMWGKKVDKMPDEQVIAIYMNPHIVMPKNHGRSQAQQVFKTYTDDMLLDNQFVRNPSGFSISGEFKVGAEHLNYQVSPDYRVCPHCGARLDLDEHCDCYESHETQGL